MLPIKKHKGYALAEVLLASVIAVTIAAGLATMFAQDRQDQAERETAGWMAAYINAVAAFMSRQGPNDPVGVILPEDTRMVAFAREQVGTDWLKPTACGGAFNEDDAFLSCQVPNDFLSRFELPQPRVRFYWSDTPVGPIQPSGLAENNNVTARTPRAVIDIGVTADASGDPDSAVAAGLATEINRRLEVDGYEHAEAFNVDPFVDPAGAPAVFAAEVASANLRAVVDSSIRSTVFVRIDGETPMTGTLRIERDDDFSLVTFDAGDPGAGTDPSDIADAQNPEASLNVNDIFLRSGDTWISEVNELAEEAFNIAARAPSFMVTVPPVQGPGVPTRITQPECPDGLVPEITVTPAGFLGGTSAAPRLVAGVRTRATSLPTAPPTWELGMDILFDGSGGFQPVNDPNLALVLVITKCSDAP